MTILIADDDATIRVLVEGLVHKWGYESVIAINGKDALSILQRDDAPQIAVMDWMMPEVSGIEVCRQAKEGTRTRPLYIIMLTASRKGKEDVVAALDAGADDYVMKPFVPTELHARIRAGSRTILLEMQLREQMKELKDALAQVKTLTGLLPICSSCKKIRDKKGDWNQLEAYVMQNASVKFTHGMCPECMEKYYVEFTKNV